MFYFEIMASNESETGNDSDSVPGAMFNIFLQMEDLLEKLKILNYDTTFLRKSNAYKPLTRLRPTF